MENTGRSPWPSLRESRPRNSQSSVGIWVARAWSWSQRAFPCAAPGLGREAVLRIRIRAAHAVPRGEGLLSDEGIGLLSGEGQSNGAGNISRFGL